jgi:uncharacterized membrane protein
MSTLVAVALTASGVIQTSLSTEDEEQLRAALREAAAVG